MEQGICLLAFSRSLKQMMMTGSLRWPGIQLDVRGNTNSAGVDHLKGTNFSPFSPSSNPYSAAVKPRGSQSSKRSTRNFTEMKKEYPTSRSGSVEGFRFFGPVNYMIFGASGGYPIHACESSSMSTCREEPPKTATFCKDLDHWYNVDDSGWNLSTTWETTESAAIAHLSYLGVPRVKERAWEQAGVE